MQRKFKCYARKISSLIIVLLFSTSLWQLAAAGWIQSKAIIAQQLLNHSWHKTLNNKTIKSKPFKNKKVVIQKPWPWADTWPVAKLIMPQHNIEQIILAGDSGSSLAFAPGYSLASSLPNSQGTTVISAHRDTHFNFLKDIKVDEMFFLQTVSETVGYRVYDLQIVDSKTYTIQTDTDDKTLILVTCYPFDAITTGGTLRYLVFAAPDIEENII